MEITITKEQYEAWRSEQGRLAEEALTSGLDLMRSMDPRAIAYRRNAANVDADIEGLSRNEEFDMLEAQWDLEGHSPEKQAEMFQSYIRNRYSGDLSPK